MTNFTEIGDNLEKWNKDTEKYLPSYFIQYLKNKYNVSLNDLKKLYFAGGRITQENRKNLTVMFTDLYMVEGDHKTIKIQLEKSRKPTYFYIYTYDKTISALKNISKINEKGELIFLQYEKFFFNFISFSGAAHTDELENLFRQKFYEKLNIPPLKKGTDRYRLMEQMTGMWVNFASTGYAFECLFFIFTFFK